MSSALINQCDPCRPDKLSGARVLVILPRWSRTLLSNNVGKMMRRLEHLGAIVSVYCAPSEEDWYFNEFFLKSRLLNVRTVKSGLATYLRLCRVLVNYKFDIVLWTYAGSRENHVLALLSFVRFLPYVLKMDSWIPRQESTVRGRLASVLERLSGLRAKLILAETEEVRRAAERFYGSRNIYLFPNGVPIREFRLLEETLRDQSSPLRNPFILYTGRVHYEKGVDLLIDCFASISASIPEWKLVIVGPSWDARYEQACKGRVAKAGLADKVLFYPWLAGLDLYTFYHFADFFVLPSRHEGLANRLTEAMFFRNPVVAFDVGQMRSMVDERTGELISPGDTVSFSAAMLNLATNPELRRIKGESARVVIEKNHDDDILMPRLLSEINKIL